MKKLIIFILLVLVGLYYVNSNPNIINSVHDLFNQYNLSSVNHDKNIQTILENNLNRSVEVSVSGNDNLILAFSGPLPDEVFDNCFKAADYAYTYTHAPIITVIGYLNSSELEPLVKLTVIDGNLNNATVEDIRTPEFKIKNTLLLYDSLPYNISVDSNKAYVSFEYLGNSTSFKNDVANMAFNIFEDAPWIDTIDFKLIGVSKNLTFSISRDEVFNNLD